MNKKFEPSDIKEEKEGFEFISVNVFPGEKALLMEAINKIEHPHRSFAQLNRAALNTWLKENNSKFRLTVR